MSLPQVAIPKQDLIRSPIDAIVAAITVFISAEYGLEAINNLPEEGKFLNDGLYWIKCGDEAFAEAMAEAAHEMADEDKGCPPAFILALSVAAEAGVYYAKADEISAWRRASYASLLLGLAAGSCIDGKGSLRKVMTALSEKAAKARQDKLRPLRAFAIGRYRSKHWPSPNNAAYQLKAEVMAEAGRLGERMSESNAQNTIAKWFREADRDAVQA